MASSTSLLLLRLTLGAPAQGPQAGPRREEGPQEEAVAPSPVLLLDLERTPRSQEPEEGLSLSLCALGEGRSPRGVSGGRRLSLLVRSFMKL